MANLPSQLHELFRPRAASPQFSVLATACLAVVFFLCVGFLGWAQLSMPKLDRVAAPERALQLVANQVLALQEGLEQVPEWERQLNEVFGGGGDELDQFITWFAELSGASSDPLVSLYLVVLQAEAGRLAEIPKEIQGWSIRPAPFPLFAEIIEAAYLNPRTGAHVAKRLQAQLAEVVPEGWFYSRLAIQIAQRGNDPDLQHSIQQTFSDRAWNLVLNHRMVTLLEAVCFMGGSIALGFLFWRWRKYGPLGLRVGQSFIPPPWRGRDGLTVLLRGGAMSCIILIALSLSGIDENVLKILLSLVIFLPVLVLAYHYLLVPSGISVIRATGMRVVPQGWSPAFLFTIGLFALGMIGGWVLGFLAGGTTDTLHWTDWFDSMLVEGTIFQVLASLFSYTILAPVLEELVFRGVLFASLRRRFSANTSIILSAIPFALAHGYGTLGSLTIFWSGVLWAWAYEKTGSLLPGILAHALNNGLVFLMVLLLIRPG